MLNDKGIEHDFMPGYNLFTFIPSPITRKTEILYTTKINYSIKLSAEDEIITRVTR